MTNFQALANIGWSPFFQQQLSLEEWTDSVPARVMEQNKTILSLATDTEEINFPLNQHLPAMVVGDWLLLNTNHQFHRLLERKSSFKRKAAGAKVGWQLISANVDTAFIVCSLNDDFNLSRIERYLALVHSAEVEPVVVFTKADLISDADPWKEQVSSLGKALAFQSVNALDASSCEILTPWLGAGKTVVLLGSSGVGKSTLANTLSGQPRQKTQGIREDDSKGRHTTTQRSLFTLPSGGLLLDTPGMRELQIADCHEGILSAFTDIENIAQDCRFSDCSHQNEPNCAVKHAVANGNLDKRRYQNYLKLLKEEALNSASLAQRRASEKSFGKFIKHTLKETQKLKGRG